MIIPAKSIILASIGKPISDTAEGKKMGWGALLFKSKAILRKNILPPKTGGANDPPGPPGYAGP